MNFISFDGPCNQKTVNCVGYALSITEQVSETDPETGVNLSYSDTATSLESFPRSFSLKNLIKFNVTTLTKEAETRVKIGSHLQQIVLL